MTGGTGNATEITHNQTHITANTRNSGDVNSTDGSIPKGGRNSSTRVVITSNAETTRTSNIEALNSNK